MDVNIYHPNPALEEILVGAKVHDLVSLYANQGRDLFQAIVAKRSGALAASARAHAEIEPVIKGQPRWVGYVTVGEGLDYALPHQFGRGIHENSIHDLDSKQDIIQDPSHDLNRVLEELGF